MFVGDANTEHTSPSYDKAEKYNEFYYEQKSTVDDLDQNKMNPYDYGKNDFDLSEFDNVSFSKLIRNTPSNGNDFTDRYKSSDVDVGKDGFFNEEGEIIFLDKCCVESPLF